MFLYIFLGVLALIWFWGMLPSPTYTDSKYVIEKPKLPTKWNTLKSKEVEYGVWEKEGQDFPNDKEIFFATPIKEVNENGNSIIIQRWITKDDAIKCIDEVFKNL